MRASLLLAALLLTAIPAYAQPTVTSPGCVVSWTETWVFSELAMRPYEGAGAVYPKPTRWLGAYEVEIAPTRTGPWTWIGGTTVTLFPPRTDPYAWQCPGYVASGSYWLRLRPVSLGGWNVGGHTRPVLVTLDRGE